METNKQIKQKIIPVLVAFLTISILSILKPTTVKAEACEITLTEISKEKVLGCIGNFKSEKDLGNALISANWASVKAEKLKNFIRDFSPIEAENGTYYACFEAYINAEYQDQTIPIHIQLRDDSCKLEFNPTDDAGKILSTKDLVPEYDMCNNLIQNNDIAVGECQQCAENEGIWTALGCISFEPQNFIKDFLQIAIGIAGGIALLLMIYGSFLISSSVGDPKKAEEGKEIITGTIAGLLFIIFSVVLLKLIGVEILSIPGF